jgi:ABC-type uncharacterized transport system involved in gliding motility auxiliary subunit
MNARATFSLTVLLSLFIAVVGGVLAHRHDRQWDWSAYSRNTLSPQTVQVLQSLERPVELLAFYRDVPGDEAMLKGLFDLYRQHTGLLELEFVDIDRQPEIAEAYRVTENRTVVLTSADLQVRAVAPGEAALTGALLRLLSDRPPRLLFLSGYNGASIQDASPGGLSQLADFIRRQNFQVDEGSLIGVRAIPGEIDCVVLAAPEFRMGEREREMLLLYLLRGGRLFTMLEPLGAADVDSMLIPWGLRAHDGFVIDPSRARENIAGPNSSRIALALRGNPEHPITRELSVPTLFPIAKSFESIQPPPPGIEPIRLVATQPEAWLESDYSLMAFGDARLDASTDVAGPLGLAYAIRADLRRFRHGDAEEGLTSTLLNLRRGAVDFRDSTAVDTLRAGAAELTTALKEEARLVVVGDVDFVNNANLLVRGNSQLLLGILYWLTDQESRVALPPRPNVADPIVLTERQRAWIRILGIGVGPGIPLLGSVVVLWRRRRWL